MPYMKKGKRNYKLEYELYHARPEQRHNRSLRTTARNEAIQEGRVSRGDGKDLDHVKPLSKGGSNSRSNTRVTTQSSNRSFARGSKGQLISQTSKREKKR